MKEKDANERKVTHIESIQVAINGKRSRIYFYVRQYVEFLRREKIYRSFTIR